MRHHRDVALRQQTISPHTQQRRPAQHHREHHHQLSAASQPNRSSPIMRPQPQAQGRRPDQRRPSPGHAPRTRREPTRDAAPPCARRQGDKRRLINARPLEAEIKLPTDRRVLRGQTKSRQCMRGRFAPTVLLREGRREVGARGRITGRSHESAAPCRFGFLKVSRTIRLGPSFGAHRERQAREHEQRSPRKEIAAQE